MTKLAIAYRDHAMRAQAEADAATLDNVRERNLRAAKAWSEMADRQERTEEARATREAAVSSVLMTAEPA
jgi:hypothetical protein